jgi:hypothetical protein
LPSRLTNAEMVRYRDLASKFFADLEAGKVEIK